MVHFQNQKSRRHKFWTIFLKLIGAHWINLRSLYIKFQEKIFTGEKIIQLWNFGNFGMLEIIPKILVTLRFSKISLHELKGNCKCFKMRYWPHFYVDPTHSNTYFSKVGIWRVLLQGTVCTAKPPNTLPRIALTPILHCFELGLKILQIHWFFRVTLFL